MKSFAVIGLGLFGTQLAKNLFDAGYNVLAIDKNEELIENIADSVTRALTLDAKNRDALSHVGIQKYDCVIMAITSDLATAVLITMNLKALNVSKIVCKVQSEREQEVLENLGATSCLIPEHIAADKLARKLTGRNVIDFTQLSDHHSILEITVPHSWIGKSVKSINIRVHHGVNVIGVRHNQKVTVNFDPDMPFSEGDELIIIGNNKNLEKVQRIK